MGWLLQARLPADSDKMQTVNTVDGQHRQDRVIGDYDQDISERSVHRIFLRLILLGAVVAALPTLQSRIGLPAMLAGYAIAAAIWWTLPAPSTLLRPAAVLSLAILLRIILLVPEPALSGDVYRYLWDGRVAAAGINPYRYAPDAPELRALRTEWHSRINHPEIATIYPPFAQALFLPVGAWVLALPLWKLLLLFSDAVAALLLWRLNPTFAIRYLFCPLVLVEVSWSGHLEGVVACLLLACFVSAREQRWHSSGLQLALAFLTKITPLAVLPSLLKRSRWRVFPSFILVSAGLTVPFIFSGWFMPGFAAYAQRWSFNSPAYAAAEMVVRKLGVSELLKQLFTLMKDPLSLESIAPFVYRSLYPEMIARGMLALCIVLALVLILRRARTMESEFALLLSALLLLAPTIHPWYWVPVLPFALLSGHRTLLLLAVVSPTSYLLYDGVAPATVMAFCYGLPAIFFLYTTVGRLEKPYRAGGPASL